MGYKIKAKSLPKMAAAPHAKHGPDIDHGQGLNDGETVLELDTGETVSIVVTTERLENGMGLAFIATSRVLEDDGSTAVDDSGQPVFTEFRHTAKPAQLELLGVDKIAREVMLMVLGEDPNKTRDDEDVIPWSLDVKLSVSVRSVNKMAKRSGKTVDAAKILTK